MHSNTHPEPEERSLPWAHYTPEQLKTVKEIAEYQSAHGTPDGKFAKAAGADGSAWNRVRRGLYGGKFGGSLDNIISSMRRKYTRRDLVAVEHTRVILAGIQAARVLSGLNDEKRAFWVVGETGGGKTTLARAIEQEEDGIRIHATPAWKVSYRVILSGVAKKLGLGKLPHNTEQAEAQIVTHLSTSNKAHVLVFEEVQQQNSRTIKELLFFWMMLLNETRAIVVILTVQRFFDDFKVRGEEYATQFLRRTLVMKCSAVTAKHAADFLERAWPALPHLDRSSKALAKAANTLGGFDLLREVIDLLKMKHKDAPPGAEDVSDMITIYYRRHAFDAKESSSTQP